MEGNRGKTVKEKVATMSQTTHRAVPAAQSAKLLPEGQ
jgi:hypothetical protein